MDETTLKRLLAEGESSRLDFKSRQYRFTTAEDADKSELLKDVLAMANAWREQDGYLILGVEEKDGAPPHISGIHEHLDDAALQQFINSKTNRPIRFAYSEMTLESGATVGIFRVPVQLRPLYARKAYGSVKAHTVYFRRGSSTAVATPDDIHEMGVAASSPESPSLLLAFADTKNRVNLGKAFALEERIYFPAVADPDLPAMVDKSHPRGILAGNDFLRGQLNPSYWKKLRDYLFQTAVVKSVGFTLTNNSGTVAEDVRAEIRFPVSESLVVLERRPSFPPYRHQLLVPAPSYLPRSSPPDVQVQKFGDTWQLDIQFGKVQPRSTVWTEKELLIGATDTRTVVLDGSLFGDNFEPLPVQMEVVAQPRARPMRLDDLQRLHDKRRADD